MVEAIVKPTQSVMNLPKAPTWVLLSHSFNGLFDGLIRLTLTGTVVATAVEARHSTGPALAKRLSFDHPLRQLTAVGRPHRWYCREKQLLR
ncbi:hypothetical protein CLV58_1631 [Spirosoma oryzae]|uniref:Uncharacterized protein n=1 Tax=Spirosoma oryzae TaxID=1469603 RepID=A0A2T0RFS4_9BACT|nr:hypothetical protein CLV58_1631 [Spirosoma oryzae]